MIKNLLLWGIALNLVIITFIANDMWVAKTERESRNWDVSSVVNINNIDISMLGSQVMTSGVPGRITRAKGAMTFYLKDTSGIIKCILRDDIVKENPQREELLIEGANNRTTVYIYGNVTIFDGEISVDV